MLCQTTRCARLAILFGQARTITADDYRQRRSALLSLVGYQFPGSDVFDEIFVEAVRMMVMGVGQFCSKSDQNSVTFDDPPLLNHANVRQSVICAFLQAQ